MSSPDIPTWLKVIGGIISILSVLVALTVYFTRLKLEGNRKLRKCQSAMDENRSTIAALEASVQALSQSLSTLRKGKEDAYTLLNELDELLRKARATTGATADSILIEDPYLEGSLSFLVVHGEAANKIKKMKVPINDSLAGTVYKHGRHSFYPSRGESISKHHTRTDKKADYQSSYVMCVPLQVGSTTVGVLQLLNKSDGTPFDQSDLSKIEHLCSNVAIRVRTLSSDLDTLKVFGIAESPDESTVSVLFGDITNFSSLYHNLQISEVTSLVNEYFERLCSIGLRKGCTIDKFLGDGFMLRFNAPRALSGYALAAIKSAFAMQTEFDRLREEWVRLGLSVENLSHRVGIATGTVLGGLMGHSQYLSYTVMGETVNQAAHLCEIARESRSGIVVCKTTFELTCPQERVHSLS